MPLSERRQIENEMIFRRLNEKIGDDLDDLDEVYVNDKRHDLLWDDDFHLDFKCECSDENCDKRISMKLSVYKKIHENRDAFVIKLKHQVEEIEKVILTEDIYCVVEKNNTTPEPNDILKNTTIDNS